MNVWDLDTKKRVATLTGHNSTVTSMALSEDGCTLLTAGRDKVRLMCELFVRHCRMFSLAPLIIFHLWDASSFFLMSTRY